MNDDELNWWLAGAAIDELGQLLPLAADLVGAQAVLKVCVERDIYGPLLTESQYKRRDALIVLVEKARSRESLQLGGSAGNGRVDQHGGDLAPAFKAGIARNMASPNPDDLDSVEQVLQDALGVLAEGIQRYLVQHPSFQTRPPSTIAGGDELASRVDAIFQSPDGSGSDLDGLR